LATEEQHAEDKLDESRAITKHLTRILIMWWQEVSMPKQHVYMHRKFGLKCTDICSCYECTNCLPDEDDENGSDAFDSDTED